MLDSPMSRRRMEAEAHVTSARKAAQVSIVSISSGAVYVRLHAPDGSIFTFASFAPEDAEKFFGDALGACILQMDERVLN